MSAAVDELRRLIDAQREEFLGSLGARLAAIETICRRIEAGCADDLDRQRVQRTAHALAGSSGMYGYPGIGAAARRLERALETGNNRDLGAALAKLKGQLP